VGPPADTRKLPVRRRAIFRRLGAENGAILVLVAALLLVFMVFAAFTVDLGFRHVERRQAQTAADTSALAGAIKAFVSEGDLQAAVDDAIALADTNTRWTISSADWLGCTDPERLSVTAIDHGLSPATECVSFSGSFDEIRIQLPVAQIDTFFAKIIGIDTLPVTAAAQASIELPGGSSSPPFVVLADANAGEEVCLRSSSSGSDMPGQWVGNEPGPGDGDNDNLEEPPDNDPTQPLLGEDGYQPDPCEELPGTSQFFGTLDPYFYEDANPASNPNTECRQPLGAIRVGIAEGIDHPLAAFSPDYPDPTDDVRVDGDGCPQGPATPWPNTMATQPGFTAQVLRCGLLSSGSGVCSAGPVIDGITYEARFKRGFHTGSEFAFAGETMENRTLWSFLRSDMSAATVPLSCSTLQAEVAIPGVPVWDYFDFKKEMLTCLEDWDDSFERLFGDEAESDDDLLTSARFAFIPMVSESSFSVSPVHFNSFVPIYLQTLYQSGNRKGNPDVMCFSQAEGVTGNSGWYRHEAGLPFNCGRSNQNVDRVAAIVLDCGMLPVDKCDPDPGPGPGGQPVFEVLLTR